MKDKFKVPRAKKGSNIVGEMVEPSITVPTLQISDMPAVKPKRKYVRKAPKTTNEVLPTVPTTALGGAVAGGIVKKRVKAIEAKSVPAPTSMTTQEKRLKALEKARAVRKANKESGIVSVRKAHARPKDVSKEHYAETMKFLREAHKADKKGARGRPSDVSKEDFAETMEYLRGAKKADKKNAKYMERMDRMALRDARGLNVEHMNHLYKEYRKNMRLNASEDIREFKKLAKEARKEVRSTGAVGNSFHKLNNLLSVYKTPFGTGSESSSDDDMYGEL
jgi:hypothetical protein